MKWLLAMLMLVLAGSVSATELGVNYYHETMMGSGYHYITRSTTQVGSDLDNIKTISSHVKLYSNPHIVGNKEWAASVASIAKSKGFYTVMVMNTEDRILSATNWGDYSAKVIENCQYFAGKVNEFVVGNEISLHSSMSRSEIKSKVVPLITSCKQYFPGTVAYEAFWYEKDDWKGYTGKLYFNMYENLNSFTTNIKEMKSSFPTADVGEWGEDLFDEGTQRDESWQKQEVQKRYDVIKQQNPPVAYVFTYKEPSYTGFGLVRSDDTKRPAWGVFGTIQSPTPTPSPTPTGSYTVILPPSGSCETRTYGTSQVKTCDKGSGTYEMYYLGGSSTVCYKTTCVSPSTGYAKFTVSSTTTTTSPTPTPTATVLPSGGCGTYTNTYGTTVMICDKGSGWYEMYLQKLGTADYCYKTYCVGANTGYARFMA